MGSEGIQVSHLQFADDALFIEDWSTINATNLKHILKFLEGASRLLINLQKSKLFGIGVPMSETTRLANYLR